ncbi:MAG: hypothetical protein AAF560_27390 [Acidobacteriota bacterium]
MRSTKLPSWTKRLLGLNPVASPPHVFSLDERQLRYGCFHRGPQGFVYEAAESVDVPEGFFTEGPLGGPLATTSELPPLIEDVCRRLPEPVKEASLVVPDTWLRLTFSEIGELPRKTQAREDMLRWKLKRLVPFRIEDLRISAEPVTPFPNQEEPARLLIGFAVERLLTQIEDAFRATGIALGRITNTTLAVAASLEHALDPDSLVGLVTLQSDAYTLSFYRQGEPVLYRYKAITEGVVGSSVRRDLRLTTSFLQQHFDDTPLRRLFLAAPQEEEEVWLEWLFEEFGITPEPLAFEHFDISRTQVGPTWLETAPLLGAASLEVS